MDVIRRWVASVEPGRARRPDDPAGLHATRGRSAHAFPDLVAYGFFPQRAMTLYEAAPLIHSANERIPVADLGTAADFFALRREGDLWLTSDETSCASAAWRCATACSCTGRRTGPPRCAPPTARSASRRAPSRASSGPVMAIPGARGVIRLGEAMAVIPLVKRALPEARLPFQNAPVLGRDGRGRRWPARVLRRRTGGVRGEAASAAVSLVPSLFALRGGDLAAYHGVEHKAIAAYEHGDQDAADAAKEHDRCGSHLMAPMLAANVAGAALLKKLVERPRPVHGAALSLASVGLAVEVFAWSERHTRLEDRESPARTGP